MNEINEIIKKDILAVLNELLGILETEHEKDVAEIKRLSNRVIHDASIFQDEDSVSIAILVYSLSKIIERAQANTSLLPILDKVRRARDCLQSNEYGAFRNEIKNTFEAIASIDSKLKMYTEEVIIQAQIRKGCKICAHGISAGRASDILGISQWELLDYLGKTSLLDRFEEPINAKTRIGNARKLFT